MLTCTLLLLASCGGGDGSAPASLLVQVPPASPVPTPAPTPTSQQRTFPGQPTIVLTEAMALKATYSGQVIENLWVEASGTGPAIDVSNFDGVVIRNVVVFHMNGPGILIANAANVTIDNVRVINRAAPDRGPHAGERPDNRVNIVGLETDNLQIKNTYLEKGSSGIYLLDSRNPVLSRIQGFDFRGPLPRGQLVQFDKCINPVLDTFSVVNPGSTAWTEDVINAYGSIDPIIRNGYIEGVNSPTGHGVLIENGAGGSGGLVENVDVRYWVNGAFMAATDSRNVTFRNVRAFDGLALASVSDSAGKSGSDGMPVPTLEQWAGENFRGPPSSGQEAFFSYNAARPGSIAFERAGYSLLARANRVAWDVSLMTVYDFYPTSENPRPPFKLPSP